MVGQAYKVRAEFTAKGSRPGSVRAGTSAARQTTPAADEPALPFSVNAELQWLERVQALDGPRRVRRVVRRLQTSSANIGGFRASGQQIHLEVRPEVGLLVADRRGDSVVVFSVGGPLTRTELGLVQTVGDPLLIADLLPGGAVKPGDSWEIPISAARALSDYDTVTSSSVKATLEACNEAKARVTLLGEIQGRARGGDGSIAVAGHFEFDRLRALLTRLELERAEARGAGPIETALDATSTLKVERSPIAVPDALNDAALEGLPLDPDCQRELLLLDPPGAQYTLLHDRSWHLVRDSTSRVVLVRLEGDRAVARCDLALGPNAGRGRHQDLGQFREDVRVALGAAYGRIVGAGDVGGAAAGGYRYRLAVEGAEDERGAVPLSYCYLIASAEGEQLFALFRLTRVAEAAFGEEDLRLIGSLEWMSAGVQPAP
jgi:hypothetical protein